jgi:hypothetical protein
MRVTRDGSVSRNAPRFCSLPRFVGVGIFAAYRKRAIRVPLNGAGKTGGEVERRRPGAKAAPLRSGAGYNGDGDGETWLHRMHGAR